MKKSLMTVILVLLIGGVLAASAFTLLPIGEEQTNEDQIQPGQTQEAELKPGQNYVSTGYVWFKKGEVMRYEVLNDYIKEQGKNIVKFYIVKKDKKGPQDGIHGSGTGGNEMHSFEINEDGHYRIILECLNTLEWKSNECHAKVTISNDRSPSNQGS